MRGVYKPVQDKLCTVVSRKYTVHENTVSRNGLRTIIHLDIPAEMLLVCFLWLVNGLVIQCRFTKNVWFQSFYEMCNFFQKSTTFKSSFLWMLWEHSKGLEPELSMSVTNGIENLTSLIVSKKSEYPANAIILQIYVPNNCFCWIFWFIQHDHTC